MAIKHVYLVIQRNSNHTMTMIQRKVRGKGLRYTVTCTEPGSTWNHGVLENIWDLYEELRRETSRTILF